MIIRYTGPTKEGRLGQVAVEFDKTGRGYVIESDSDVLKEAIEKALKAPISTEIGELRDGAIATVPLLAQPGTPQHAMAMINPGMLLEQGIRVVAIEGEMLKV